MRREATSLTRAGYDVSIICPAAPGQPRRENIDGVRLYRYPPPRDGAGTLGYAFEYAYSLLAAAVISAYVALRRGFDIVHAHNPPDMYVFLAAFYRLFGRPFVFDHHDLSPEMFTAKFGKSASGTGLVARALLACEKLSFRLADLVISTNESYRTVALSRGGVRPERVWVVRNGPDHVSGILT